MMDFITDGFCPSHLGYIISTYGYFTYAILFRNYFGKPFIFTPFLPGDSMILPPVLLLSVRLMSLFYFYLLDGSAGDTVNYWVGYKLGQKIIDHPKLPVNQNHIDKAQNFMKNMAARRFSWRDSFDLRAFCGWRGRMDYRSLSI
jgi:membrane-associated protein